MDAQLAAGEITEEEYDGIREEYERWQEEQYSAGERKYSLASNAKAELHKALYDLKYRDDVRLRDETPAIMLGHKGVKNLPMAMKASHIRENIFTEDEARALGLRVDDDIHYHGLGEEFFLQVIDGLDNVKEAYRGTKNASDPTRREDYFLLVSEFTDEAGNTVNVPVYINRHSQVNRVFLETNKISTVYGKTALRDYIMMQVKNGNLVRIKRKSTESSERAAHMTAGYRNDASSEIIADDGQEVKKQFSLADDAGDGGKMPLAEFMGQYAQEKAEAWRQGSIVDDETVRQAQKAGYPVIEGVQVIPFVTWVHCTDPIPGTDKQRNNYGLVTGIGGGGKLLISFRNKGAKANTDTDADQTPSKKDDVPIAVEYLTPVRGKYQMTQAEWEALENAMPEEADKMDLSDEERAEIDELLSRATASEETEAEQESIPIQRDALPAKAAGLLQQAERKLLWDISDRLGVPKLAGREYLTPIIQQMADEYLEKGTLTEDDIGLLFDKFYANGVVACKEYLEKYSPAA